MIATSKTSRLSSASAESAAPATKESVVPIHLANGEDDPGPDTQEVTRVLLGELRPSPALAPGRLPCVAGIMDVLAHAGGARGLCFIECAPLLDSLAPDERALALLSASVATHGVEEPVVVRTTMTGLEIVDGHRRQAAAELAGLQTVPVRNLGAITDDEAAAFAARSNEHRQPLNAWQSVRLAEAVRRGEEAPSTQRELTIVEKINRVGAPRRRDSAAHVARVLGIGHSTAKDYVRIATAISEDVLVGIHPVSALAHAALGRLSFRKLRALSEIEPECDRVAAIRRATGLEPMDAPLPSPTRFSLRSGKDGAFSLRVPRTDGLTLKHAEDLLEILRQKEHLVLTRIALLTDNRLET